MSCWLAGTALASCGLLLVWMSLAGYGAVPVSVRMWVVGTLAVGALALLWGGRLLLGPHTPGVVYTGLERVAAWFVVAPAQVMLLLMAPLFSVLATATAGREPVAHHAIVSAGSWLLAIVCVVGGSVPPVWRMPAIPHRGLLWLGIVFSAAFLVRGIATEHVPQTFSGDEGGAGLFALMFLNGEANNLLTYGWYSFPSFWFAVESLGIAVLGQTIPAVRLVSALAGALTVVAVFWLGRVMFGRLHGWFAAVLLVCFHYHIHMSRIALNNVWDGLFAALALAGLWDGWRNGRRCGFVVCGLALGLGQYFYVSIRVLPLLLLIWVGMAGLLDRGRFRRRLPGLIVAAYVAAIVFLPLGVMYIAHPAEFTAPHNRVSILGDHLAAMTQESGKGAGWVLGEQLWKGLLGYIHEPLRLLYNPGMPLLQPVSAIVFLIGVALSLWRFDLRHALVWLPLLAVPVMGMLSAHPPASQRYVLAVPSVMMLLALPPAQFVSWTRRRWPHRAPWAMGVAVVLVAWIVVGNLHYYFVEVPRSYVLGGVNTEVATEVARHLRTQYPAGQRVFFHGWPRMGYYTHPTVSYMVPAMRGEDVMEPLTGPPAWTLEEPAQFIFLPERLDELRLVETAFPGGHSREIFSRQRDELLFVVYAVNP